MSQWVPDSKGLTESSEMGSNPHVSEDSGIQNSKEALGRPSDSSGWLDFSSFFLSALLYFSTFFLIFSPLPILRIGLKKGRKWAWLSALSNTLIVAGTVDSIRLLCFLVFVIILALTLVELIHRRVTVEKSAALTLLNMLLWGGVFGVGYSFFHHLNPVHELRSQISELVDLLVQSLSSTSSSVSMNDINEWKHNLVIQFPSSVSILALILVWANLTLLLKMNPSGIREKLGLDLTYFKKWKAPEFLVWPTIFFGAFLVADFGRFSEIAMNGFKFIMAIYAIQGLSILSYFMESSRVRAPFRWIGFLLSLFLMLPLISSLGFFDLWFDFRNKFRQS